MKFHKNVPVTLAHPLEMVQDVVDRRMTLAATAASNAVSVPTVRKGVGRYLFLQPFIDRSGRPVKHEQLFIIVSVVGLNESPVPDAGAAREACVIAAGHEPTRAQSRALLEREA